MRRNRSDPVLEIALCDAAATMPGHVHFAFAIIALQRLPDALGQSLLYLRELILTLVFFVVLGCVFVHLLFVHQCVVMVIEAHDLVESVSQRPVECRSQSFGFRFHCFDRWANLQIARSSALDEDSKPSRAKLRVLAVPLQRVA
jgi:hypothetical protein